MLKKLTLMTITAVSAFALHTAEININNKDLEVGMQLDVGQFNRRVEPNTMFVGAKFLNADDAHSSDSLSLLDPYYEANFLIMREIGNYGVSFGMGIKLNYTQIGNRDFSALPLGLEFAYRLPTPKAIPVSLNASLYYAPEVLSFADATNYLDYRVHFDIALIQNAGITIGYRSLNMSAGSGIGSKNYNSSAYFGFQVGF